MIKSRAVLAGSLLAIAGAASAEVSITPTLTSDYDFRGISQTDGKPAFQLGMTYAAETGMYMGIWGSNVDFNVTPLEANAKTEIDAFAGFAFGDAEEGLGYDVGAIYYSYPNQGTANFPEVYAGVAKGAVSAKLWYTWDFAGSGDTAYYLEGNFAAPMAEGFSLLGHVGHSDGEYWTGAGGLGKYLDWSAGIGYEVKNVNISFKYADGSDLGVRNPRNLGRLVFSVSTTL